jgi:putative transposase
MPDYRRPRNPGGTYFFTVVTYERRPVLTTKLVRSSLRDAINRARTTLPFDIEAWVLLPDHLHCIWTLPPGDGNFAARWAIIKRYVSRECVAIVDAPLGVSRSRRNELAFWQRRFWEHQIRDDDDLARHLDYIHWNPVKHGLVKSVKEWRYSTFHKYVVRGMYPDAWGSSEIANADGNFGE